MFQRLIFTCLLLLHLSIEASAQNGAMDEALIKAVQDNPYRKPSETVRDGARHPIETLTFFGIKPTMTVAEIVPGSGWYTNILSQYLKPKGRYVGVNYAPFLQSDPKRREAYQYWGDHFVDDVDKFGANAGTDFMGGATPMKPGHYDMILTIREWHNWINSGIANVLAYEFYNALKPGGVLGIVQHRAKPGSGVRTNSGYVQEQYLISLLQNVGFQLDGRSEINANRKDKTTWPNGVWTLPPSLALRDQDRDYYLSIGESDRMTLRFKKPN